MTEDKSAAAANASRGASAGKKSGMGLVAILLVVVIVMLGAGGAFFVFHSKKSAEAAPAAAVPAASSVKSLMHLDSFVINLEDSEGSGYLRVGIDLGLEGESKEGGESKAAESKVRDTILEVLGKRSADELLAPDGKAQLKDDLLKAIQQNVPEIHCHEIYFTEFLVQR